MKTLVMKFVDEDKEKRSLSIKDVKDNLTKEQVEGLMDLIIEKNIFKLSTADLVSKDSAHIVDTHETKLF
ncbi:DUF2922 domain-containing protein (plasmid) [Haloimpatiens sp. FM7330]|uniref:DUF2922 domain-containing protein n=1 Tax=Haloimpatiens sp. FM7330 TaxID=3298610 RepID=UPI0036282F19